VLSLENEILMVPEAWGTGSTYDAGEEKLCKWLLGETKSGTHCPECEARAGKVKSIAEWKTMGKPKCKCKCWLVPQ
jgi:hypothetical protein